jgi:hypothetical protein
MAAGQGDLEVVGVWGHLWIPAERVEHGSGVAVDVGERQLLGGHVVQEVFEGVVVEHQDLLGLDTQHVGGRR